MAIAWMLDARASETWAVKSVSCPRAFSGVADVGLAAADVMLVVPVSWCGRRGSVGESSGAALGLGCADDSGCAGSVGCKYCSGEFGVSD